MPWTDQDVIAQAIEMGFPDDWDREVVLGVEYERDQMIEKGKPEWSLRGYLGLVRKRLLVNPHHYSKIIEKEKRKKSPSKERMEPEEVVKPKKSFKRKGKAKAVEVKVPRGGKRITYTDVEQTSNPLAAYYKSKGKEPRVKLARGFSEKQQAAQAAFAARARARKGTGKAKPAVGPRGPDGLTDKQRAARAKFAEMSRARWAGHVKKAKKAYVKKDAKRAWSTDARIPWAQAYGAKYKNLSVSERGKFRRAKIKKWMGKK